MADNEKDINYENPSEAQGTGGDSLNEMLQRLFQNRLAVVALVFIVLFFLYNTFFSSDKPEPKTANKTPVPVKQVAKKPIQPIVKIPTKAPAVEVSKKALLSESDIHAMIHGDTKVLSDQYTTLINQINRVHQTLALMDKQFASVSTEMSNIKSQISGMAVRMNTMQRKIKDGGASNTSNNSSVEYTVRAVIDGRAWLREKGTFNVVTVQVGDRLPGYGQITEIDAGKGIVKTSSGRQVVVSY